MILMIFFIFNLKVNNIDPQWKKLFDTIGVTQTELEDEETSKFIYDFVESHGGIEKASEELAKSKDGGKLICSILSIFCFFTKTVVSLRDEISFPIISNDTVATTWL